MPLFAAIAAYFYARNAFVSASGDSISQQIGSSFITLLLIMLSIRFVYEISDFLGVVAERSLDRYGMHSLFRLTSGDEAILKQVERNNRRNLLKFASTAIASLIGKIAAAVVIAYYWPGK